ncbi:MAG: hypothetical protein Kow00122_19220 [Thermoleophilia bacterium]
MRPARRIAVAALLMALAVAGAVLGGCSRAETGTTPTSSTTVAPSTTAPPVTAAPSTAVGPSSSTTTAPPPGQWITEARRLSPPAGPFAICRDCHAFLDPPARKRPNLNAAFRHEKHLARGATCNACHVTPVHTETSIRKPAMAQCFTCHGAEPGAAAPGDCGLCHPPGFRTLPASHVQAFYQGGHARVVKAQGTAECFTCHKGDEKSFCRACHGLDLPHPPGWAKAESGGPGRHVQAAYDQGAVCVRCHQNRGAPPAGCYGGECHGS